MTDFRLNPALDLQALTWAYRQDRRVRIADFLAPDGARELHHHLATREDWRKVINSDDKVFELDRTTLANLDKAQRAQLNSAVMAGARSGFQFRYDTVRVADGKEARATTADLLNRFAAWMSSTTTLEFLQQVTGCVDIKYADAQATAYAPGDFLTAHDDHVAGKSRHAAYVFGLNPTWRPEWGGLLLFHDSHNRVTGMIPAFNTLDLLAVPQIHSVSYVTHAAPNRRYSITGWLRKQPQPS